MHHVVEKQLKAREHLVTALQTDLVGPFKTDEIIPTPPSRWYLTGFLVPKDAGIEQKTDIESQEDFANSGETEGDDTSDGNSANSAHRPYFSSSIGMSFLVPKDVEYLLVTVKWGRYMRLSKEESDGWSRFEREVNREFLRKTHKLIEDLDEEKEKEAFARYWKRTSGFVQTVKVPVLSEGRIDIPSLNGRNREGAYFEIRHAKYAEKSKDARWSRYSW